MNGGSGADSQRPAGGGERLRVVLGVSGGIAAYKSVEVVRALVDRNVDVRVMLTPAALRFIAPLTLSVISRNPAVHDLWDPSSGAVDHVELARVTDVLAIVPATADILAKLARGIGDEVLSTYALAHRRALVLAPAMNSWMLAHPATTENLAILRARGAVVVEPESGELACGDVGPGRLAAPARIVSAILEAGRATHELQGRTVVVTAGPTREPIDPVRFISNRSSGRMGFALAREAQKRGADVILVAGPVALAPPPGVRVVYVERTAEMKEAVLETLKAADALIMAAAPADFAVSQPAPRKLKRAAGVPEVRLTPAPDILAEVASSFGERPSRPIVVAFAAETDDLVGNARRKLQAKGADLLVANDVSRHDSGFDVEENEVVILGKDGSEEVVSRVPKTVVAARVVDRVVRLLEARCPSTESVASATR